MAIVRIKQRCLAWLPKRLNLLVPDGGYTVAWRQDGAKASDHDKDQLKPRDEITRPEKWGVVRKVNNDDDIVADVPLPCHLLPVVRRVRQHRGNMEHNLVAVELSVVRVRARPIILDVQPASVAIVTF